MLFRSKSIPLTSLINCPFSFSFLNSGFSCSKSNADMKNGMAKPRENKVRRIPPCKTVSVCPAFSNAAPRKGPMQGDQPRLNAMPISSDDMPLRLLFFIFNRFSVSRKGMRMSPVMKMPRRMMSMPDIFSSKFMFRERRLPSALPATPRPTKTIVNPRMKSAVLRSNICFRLVSPSWIGTLFPDR